ncbi:neuraminidase-like domain-containing protein [Thermosulfurimonas sp. F29]|uniref:neuraminidase-like domain-containing protein n=1 Tax=Thermosulfurimonas sp. F29 TaxID=2867247 RepID=UPI001C82FF1D|nr:neuraminidase-like domain-containing protein [Thermosulfurimonas sp. F29]MBX6421974.1 peptidoglycan-binding protein [Thermosulfurimonas sp. F29]
MADLQEALLQLIEVKREVFALPARPPIPPPVVRPRFSVPPHPVDWERIKEELKKEKSRQYYGKTTKLLVSAFQKRHHLEPTGEVDEKTANALNRALKELGLLETKEERKMVEVYGKIILEDGRPAGNIPLRFYRYLFGESVKIGETKTNEKGNYRITLEKDNRALIVEVKTAKDNKEISLSKPITLPEKEKVEINLVAPSNLLPLEPEFSRLHRAIRALEIDLKNLKDAREDEERQDLSFLSHSTGWDARLIALAADAQKISEELRLSEDVEKVYALLRTGLPRDKELLVQLSAHTVEKALKKAKEANIVKLSDREIAEFKKRFSEIAAEERLKVRIPGSGATFGEFVSEVIADRERQKIFISLIFEHKGDEESLWKRAEKAGFRKEEIQKLKLQGKLAFLTANSHPLVSHLMKEVEDPEELVEKDFYKPGEWEETIRDLAQNNEEIEKIIPPIYEGKTEEKLRAYAKDLALKIRRSYPTQVVARMIEVKPEHFGVKNDSLPETLRQLAKKGFRIGQTPIETFMKQDGNLRKQIEEVKPQIKELHRVYQITPTDEAMPVLYNLDMTSARAVTAIPEEEFVKRFEAEYKKVHNDKPPKNVARLVYRKAEQVESTVLNLATTARWLGSLPPIHVLPNFGEARDKAIKELPTLEKLFGSLDFCECEHCHSVLSPAAYLVDLLHSLERWGETVKNGKKPYDVLTERRPDIPHIPLTCENTYTTMPYIDIVNEILEYWVVHNRLDEGAAHDTGKATSEELIAEPQYIEPKAYEILQDQRYPLNLPFDLWIETAREFCNYFEIPLWRLLEVFRPTNELFDQTKAYDYSKIFMEQLGLSPSEFELFTDENLLNTWYELYGYENESEAWKDLSGDENHGSPKPLCAKTLARRLGVTYKELVEILKTWFVNPRLNENPVLPRVGVSIHDIPFYDIPRVFPPIGIRNLYLWTEHRSLIEREPGTLTNVEEKLRRRIKPVDRFVRDFLPHIPDLDLPGFIDVIKPDVEKTIVLADEEATCDFGKTKVMYADGTPLKPVDLIKINLFVRLWKKLGWSIEELDQALKIFIPKNVPFNEAHISQKPLKTALIYLAHLKALEEKLNLGKDERIKILTLWSDIPTAGEHSLYAELFLKPDIVNTYPVFDHPLGHYLQGDVIHPLRPYLPALQAALGLTAEEIGLILEDNDLDNAFLTLSTVSLLYRYGLLAKALRISVSELISLKKLSGIDPFMSISENALNSLEEDAPYQTIRFIEMVERVKESGFKVEDLNYLFLHQFDPTGKYRPDKAGTRLFLKTIADGIRSIRAEHAAPDDPSTLSEDVLRQKLGLILPPDVVDRFLAMLAGRAEFTAIIKTNGDNKLDPETFKDEPSIIDVSYDSVKGEQRLTYRGVLFEDSKAELIAKFENKLTDIQKNIFSQLLNDIQNQAKDFFDTWLKRSGDEEIPTTGFFEEGDYGWLFGLPFKKNWSEVQSDLESIDDSHVDVPVSIKALLEKRNISLNDTAKIEKVEDNLWQIQDNGRILRIRKLDEEVDFTFDRKKLIAETFFPYLQARLIKDLVVKSLAEKTGADSSLVEMLVTDENMLSLSDSKSLLDNFVSSAEKGITAIVDSTTKLVDDADTALTDTQAGSARFECYIVFPTPGPYRFYIEADEGVKYELRFDHLSKPLLSNMDSDGETSAYTEFKANIPYRFTLELENIQSKKARLLVRGENLPKGSISRLALYPAKEMDEAEKAYVLLSKALQLFATFELKEREVRYLLTHIGNFRMPVSAEEASVDKAQKLFSKFLSLCLYSSLKKDLAGNTEDLVDVLEAEDKDAYLNRIAELTRRDPDVVKQTADILFESSDDETNTFQKFDKYLQRLNRLWDALQIVHRFGVSPEEIADWRGIASRDEDQNEIAERREIDRDKDRAQIAQRIRNAIKARFERSTWLKVIQPISDRLRKKKRDALSAYVMHKLGYERIEQLYEHFLIDPGMEPVVWTSRIRLAIASVQLFIQRCLLNLEKDVPASAINTKEWEWMKRYRVWEANRKIFLWPENWLEPEFRDDKTHLFQELEGTLLQGDVSEELVEDAFLNYLKKLDELARLDIVAAHIEYRDDPDNNILHVFGRTYNQPHKYFYRRYQHGEWTPWEPMNIEIQGDHLAPVVWHDRLWLFWVTFIEKPVSPGNSDENKSETIRNLADKPISEMSGKKELHAQLHWSIYDKGKWSAPQVSGFEALKDENDNPVKIPQDFDPKNIFVWIYKEEKKDEEGNKVEGGVYVNLGYFQNSFYLISRNSPPSIKRGMDLVFPYYNLFRKIPSQTKWMTSGDLTLDHPESKGPLSVDMVYSSTPILDLDNDKNYTLLFLNNLKQEALFSTPFFYQDDEHTFFVEPGYEEPQIPAWERWVEGLVPPVIERFRDLEKEAAINSFIPIPEKAIPPIDKPPIDPRSRFRIKEPRDWLIKPATVLDFRGIPIGERGKVFAELGRTGIRERGINLIGHEGLIGSGFTHLRSQLSGIDS